MRSAMLSFGIAFAPTKAQIQPTRFREMAMNMRKTWMLAAGAGLLCTAVALLVGNPTATAQTKVVEKPVVIQSSRPVEVLTPHRFHLTMTGAGSSFIVIDTATGRCWLSSPDKREWQDIGAPPPYSAVRPPVAVPVVPTPPVVSPPK
jgi:hypothetical protein